MSDDEKEGYSSIRFKQYGRVEEKKNEELNSSEIGKGDNNLNHLKIHLIHLI